MDINTLTPCRREEARTVVARASTVRTPDEAPCDVTVEDLSPAGFSFTSTVPIATDTPVRVGLAGGGRATARVAWRYGARHGCIFHPSLTAAQVEAAFTQAGVVAIAQFAPMLATPGPALRIPPVVRLALMVGGGGLGWIAFASILDRLT